MLYIFVTIMTKTWQRIVNDDNEKGNYKINDQNYYKHTDFHLLFVTTTKSYVKILL